LLDVEGINGVPSYGRSVDESCNCDVVLQFVLGVGNGIDDEDVV